MRVLVTGGTGFVGYHTVKALRQREHQVVLLVRSQEKAAQLFASAGVQIDDYVCADICDRQQLAAAMQGCDGCLHAAAITPLQAADDTEVMRVNLTGTQAVLETALAQGVKNIVYLSSIAAIFDRDPRKVNPQAPVEIPQQIYGKSKALAEIYVRQLQQRGEPIATIYPGGIVGPEDPALSATIMSLRYRLSDVFTETSSGTQQLDVRDLAGYITALLERGVAQPEQYLLAGHYLSWTEFADLLEQISGRPLNRKKVPGWLLRAMGTLNDIKRKVGMTVASPVSAETMKYTTQWPKIDNTAALQTLDFTLRPPQQTFTDTLRWMKQKQLLSQEQLPLL